jgi:hypothetical protein
MQGLEALQTLAAQHMGSVVIVSRDLEPDQPARAGVIAAVYTHGFRVDGARGRRWWVAWSDLVDGTTALLGTHLGDDAGRQLMAAAHALHLRQVIAG